MRPVSTEKKIVEKNIFFLNLVFESWYETVVLVFFTTSHLMPSFVHLIALCLPKMHWESWISESRSQGSTEHPMKSEPATTWFQVQLLNH